MQKERIVTLFISILLLLSLTTTVSAEENDYYLVANTTSDADGNFVFEDIPNGEYLLYAVNYSSGRNNSWYWYNAAVDLSVNSSDLSGLEIELSKESGIDENEVLAYLDKSAIEGTTYSPGMNGKINYKSSTLVLVDKITDEVVTNTTSDSNGNFTFVNIPNGDYLLYAVNYSSGKNNSFYWYNAAVDLSVNSSDLSGLEIELSKESGIDENEVLAYLDKSAIEGTTYSPGMNGKINYKSSTLVLVDKITDEVVTNTTSDSNGNFTFVNIPNGDYLLYAVNYSSGKNNSFYWYNAAVDLSVNSSDLSGLEIELSKESGIDEKEVLAYLDRSAIEGITYSPGMNGKINYKSSTLILLKQKVVSETSNAPHLNVSIITGYSSYKTQLANFKQRINSDSSLNITASYYITDDLPENIDFNNTDIIYIKMVTQTASELEEQVQFAIDNGALVIGQNTELPESDYSLPSDYNTTDKFKEFLGSYWSGTSINDTNLDNLIFYLAKEYYDRDDLAVEEPEELEKAIYHPAITDSAFEYMISDAEEYFSWYSNRTDGHAFDADAPTIGITFYSTYYPTNIDPVDSLIESFEAKGANVIACYGDTDVPIDSYLNYNEETKVDAVVSFHYRGNYFDLEELDVPVINAVLNPSMNASEWVNSSTPLDTDKMNRIYRPEGEGVIDPIMIGAQEVIQVDNSTTTAYVAVDQQIDWITDRAIAQANLGLEDESDKKVVIIYYNHGGGKDNIGASYLEVMPSIVNLLEGMADEGYDINSSAIPNKTELVDLITYQGRNVGTWAPGELEALVETGEVELIPESTYLSWFNELPEDMQEEVTETWGEAPGEIMVYTDENGDKFIVIPKINISDNVILAPQPTRGWLQDDEILYHDRDLAPHHQYIAFYLWLQNEFDADVMVNMGRHGTVEWLPGKEFGLLSDEWPALMNGDIPVIYPYVMDGLGEGIQAKRRGNAVIIDHLIPSVISAGLYGDYATLSSEITSYQTSVSEEEYKQAQFYDIVNLTIELGLDDQVNMSLAASNTTIDDFLEEVDDVLTELKNLSMPYGLHVLGEPPEGDELVGMVNSMLGDDYSELVETYNASDNASADLLTLVLLENMSTTDAQLQILGNSTAEIDEELNSSIDYAELLGESDNEVQQVLNAMDGEYIKGNLGGDPIQKPETLPSGRNFYSFDEDLIPSEKAWDNAVDLIDKWLAEYYAENGEYPTKVGYILWAGETTRHEGVMESQILYLMGIKPVWDDGEVINVTAINSSDLGRPRIDVFVQISGLYRDTFPGKIDLLDRAVRRAYEQEETADCPNYVKQSTDELKLIFDESIENETLSLDVAQFRIFGPAPGAYGTGMANAVDSSDTWENTSELAELYINKMCYIYGENIWGQTISEYVLQQTGRTVEINDTAVFENNLNGTQVIFHSRSSNAYGSLDIDDFYQYMGGLYNAISYISGDAPEMYVVNLQDLSDPEIQTLQTYIENELYARYLNPSWIAGMQLSGFEGAAEISNFIDNLYGSAVFFGDDVISNDVWNKIYDTYIGNSEMMAWLKESSPYAAQSIGARLLQSDDMGLWDASDDQLSQLVTDYMESVVESGSPACCHHTCGNLLNQENILALAELYDVSDEIIQQYNNIMFEATSLSIYSSSTETSEVSTDPELHMEDRHSGNSLTRSMAASSRSNQSSTTKTGMGENTNINPENTQKSTTDDYVEGYEMVKDEISNEPLASSYAISGSDIAAMGFVVFLLGAIYIGFWKRRKF
ncbi:Mg chelatase, cobalamin biosynthesis protein CobN [Methanolobus tindarius DSM 2278]|uniref:Mg chelatase, cobalamin biosynthesis protein CobN n=1 Tax=Methanolobus tindarius DSM 2278 TaxID=1090322 RepID=W9DQW1_METTI|nr:cobaltochelatase subunit CobN [Methanolobus tindarius]ETA69014.1 Mg chelatase, cobalamin biosynthesis protein CobN [Methanolobus tindarius DSM 2278]